MGDGTEGDDGPIDFSCPDGLPTTAVGAVFELDLNTLTTGSGSAEVMWSMSGEPTGFSLDETTGILSGAPMASDVHSLEITVTDTDPEVNDTETCSLVVNERLVSVEIENEDFHCIPHTASKDELRNVFVGGDGTDITCSPLNIGDLPCPLGDGNGRAPPGITFDADSCTHSGSISSEIRGTWVWMVEVVQGGYTTRVPFCAANDIETFHDIFVTVDNVPQSDLQPGLLEYDPAEALSFGNGSYQWDIQDPQCADNSNPAACNAFGFKFDVTCSPFDPPFVLNGASSDEGLEHQLTATGPVPSENFRYRPWVASFEVSYCTSDDPSACDVDGAFEANAQTRYHFDVVGYPNL